MSAGERIREKAYWFLDALRGGTVKKYYKDILEHYENGSSDEEAEQKLQKLFQHALRTSSYYKKLGLPGEPQLKDFPLMNKMEYVHHFDEIMSDEYKNAKGNATFTTSGSTGTPFSMVQNHDKVNRNTAVSIASNEIGGYHLGDRRAFFRVWANTNKKSTLSKIMENLITLDATSLNDEKFGAVCKLLEKKKVKSLTGYSACLADLADYIERTNTDVSGVHLNSIFGISEAMDEETRRLLQKQFGCPVNLFYSSQENGNMSMMTDEKGYRLDTSTWFIEILKFDKDEPAEEGELGRIVVTDFYNYAFPVIRYDNGDVGKMKKIPVPGTDRYKTYLTEVYGRRLDVVYNLEGNPISPHSLTVRMRGIAHLVQWKFIQKGPREYVLQINSDGPVDLDELRRRYKEMCGDFISFEYVDEIPVLASGKRKPIENLMNKK